MILSILDTDLYKFSTSNAYFQLYPLAEGTFTFNDRAKEVYDGAFLDALKEEIKALGRLALTEDEFEYVTRRIKYIPRNYWEWLTGFRFNPDLVEVRLDDEGHLHIKGTGSDEWVSEYEGDEDDTDWLDITDFHYLIEQLKDQMPDGRHVLINYDDMQAVASAAVGSMVEY